MDWIDSYAQLKFYEEVVGDIVVGVILLTLAIVWAIKYFKDKKQLSNRRRCRSDDSEIFNRSD